MRRWFHCTKCDGYAYPPSNFNEVRHFMKCVNCNELMYMRLEHVSGTPKDIWVTKKVKAEVVVQ